MPDKELITVLTGDLVDSTGLGAAKTTRALRALEASAAAQAAWHGAPLHFTRHRGDGWQVVLMRPELAWRSALAFRAALRTLGQEYDSYFGFAQDHADATFGPDLNSATDPVFAASGHALDYVKARSGLRMSYSGFGPWEAITTLVDHISQDWTPAQAAAVEQVIAPNKATTQTEAAKALGKSRQAVSKALEAASFPQLDYALRCIEDMVDA